MLTCKHPPGLYIQRADTPEANRGVWATTEIVQDAVFGPYDAEIVHLQDDTNGNSACIYIHNLKDLLGSAGHHATNSRDWIRFIRSSTTTEYCNIRAFERHKMVYYQAIRPIPSSTELVVWYSCEDTPSALSHSTLVEALELPIEHSLQSTAPQSPLLQDSKCSSAASKNFNEGWNLRDITNTIGQGNTCNAETQHADIHCTAGSVDQSSHLRVEIPCAMEAVHQRLQGQADVPLSKEAVRQSSQLQDLSILLFTCNECGKNFLSSQQLALHASIHKDVPDGISSKVSDLAYTDHLLANTINGSGIYACGQSSNENTPNHFTKQVLRDWLEHREEPTLKPNLLMSMKKDLNRHLPSVPDGNPREGLGFTKPSKKENVPKNFLCAHCGKSFSSNHKLKNHLKVHNPDRSFECDQCHKTFSREQYLKTHYRRHTGENLHHCEICQKGFVQSSDLRIHRRTHTGERPHVCTFCGKAYSVSGNLNKHLKAHHPQRTQTTNLYKII